MEFISRVRLLEANGYAVRKNFVKKKYKDDTALMNNELGKINTRMEQTKTCEDPAIAKAMSRMVDHQGWSVLKCLLRARRKNIYISTYSDKGLLIKEVKLIISFLNSLIKAQRSFNKA